MNPAGSLPNTFALTWLEQKLIQVCWLADGPQVSQKSGTATDGIEQFQRHIESYDFLSRMLSTKVYHQAAR